MIAEGALKDSWFQNVPGQPLHFVTQQILSGPNLTLKPFYELSGCRYIVYWETGSLAEADRRKTLLKLVAFQNAELANIIAGRTIDQVSVGVPASEAAHQLKVENSNTGERDDCHTRWRDASGWFSYELAVKPDRPNQLICQWWGGDSGRTFNISVDDQRITVVRHDQLFPGKVFAMPYPIPVEFTAGKQKVTVKFSAHPGSVAGGLMGTLRMIEVK